MLGHPRVEEDMKGIGDEMKVYGEAEAHVLGPQDEDEDNNLA